MPQDWNPYTATLPDDQIPPIVVPDGRPETLMPEDGARVVLTSISEGLPESGLWRQNLAIADMNGDGHLDIIAGPPRGGTSEKKPFVFLGDGKGSWSAWNVEMPHAYYQYGGVDAADIDANGLLDIAITGHYAPVYVLLQTAPGVFELMSKGLPDGAGFSSRTIKAANLDDDPWLELVLLADTNIDKAQRPLEAALQRIFDWNPEQGTWVSELEGLNDRAFGDRLVVADFNMDGRPDFAVSNHVQKGKNVLFYQTPRGWQNASIYSLFANAYTFDVSLANFNGDDRPDLLFSQLVVLPVVSPKTTRKLYHRAVLVACLNTPDGWEVRELAYLSSHLMFEAVAAADFNGDGTDDVVGLQRDGSLYLLLSEGDGFTRARIEDWNLKGRPYWAQAADVNEDGRPDLCVAFGGEEGKSGIYCYSLNMK